MIVMPMLNVPILRKNSKNFVSQNIVDLNFKSTQTVSSESSRVELFSHIFRINKRLVTNVHVTVVSLEMEFSVMTSTNAISKLITVTRLLPPVTIKKAISNAPV